MASLHCTSTFLKLLLTKDGHLCTTCCGPSGYSLPPGIFVHEQYCSSMHAYVFWGVTSDYQQPFASIPNDYYWRIWYWGDMLVESERLCDMWYNCSQSGGEKAQGRIKDHRLKWWSGSTWSMLLADVKNYYWVTPPSGTAYFDVQISSDGLVWPTESPFE